jgi:hypothetical protein
MLPELNIGLVPGCGGAIHLAQKIPFNRAFEMILFGDRLTAEERCSSASSIRSFRRTTLTPRSSVVD